MSIRALSKEATDRYALNEIHKYLPFIVSEFEILLSQEVLFENLIKLNYWNLLARKIYSEDLQACK